MLLRARGWQVNNLVSIMSGDTTMGKYVVPGTSDLGFPHQEGSFFGNVFSGEAYACQGRGVTP